MLPNESLDVRTGEGSSVCQYSVERPVPPCDPAESHACFFIESPFQMTSGNTSNYLIRSDIAGHDRPSGHDRSISDGDATEDDGPSGDPHIVSDCNRPTCNADVEIVFKCDAAQTRNAVPTCLAEQKRRHSVGRMDSTRNDFDGLVDGAVSPNRDRRVLVCVVDEPDRRTRRLLFHHIWGLRIEPDHVPEYPTSGCSPQPQFEPFPKSRIKYSHQTPNRIEASRLAAPSTAGQSMVHPTREPQSLERQPVAHPLVHPP